MAASAPPTVRPYCPSGGPVETGGAGDREMLSPVTGTGRVVRRRRVVWTVVLGLVLLLTGALAAGAWASPAVAEPPQLSPTAPPPQSTAESCSPNASLAMCSQSSHAATPATTAAPCAGEDCIPQPSGAPTPGTGQPAPGPGSGDGGPGCGITNVSGCVTTAINSVFRDLANAALSPILELLGHTALSTPTLAQLPGIGELWNNSWEIVLAAYGLFVLAAGVVVMGHESVQSRYSLKEIGPRIPIAFGASALSLFFADKFITLANALTLGVLGGVNPPSLGDTLKDAVAGFQTGSLFIILTGLVLVVLGLGLLIVYVIRIVITLILIISGPLFLMCHALPHTDPIARWWWKAITAALAIQVAQALVLITAVRTFLSGGVHLFGSPLSALGTLITAIALFFILFKIPFWLLSATKVRSGRSFLGGLVRAYIAAKTFGMVAGKAGAFGKTGAAGAVHNSAGRGPGRGGTTGMAADPPWPVQPRLAPTPAMVNRRLRQAHDAERARAARRSPLPSQAPQFLQPAPQHTTHDPALTSPTPGPTMPAFSSAPTFTAVPPVARRGGPPPAAPPQFRAPGPPRHNTGQQPIRPIRVASVPPHLQFRAPVAEPAQVSQPVKPTGTRPSAPTFRQAYPEPRIGDARARTPSVPPVAFRPPPNRSRGDRP
ncbi:hypothetical protein [Amycolatopsis pigmentata]|uniref:TrbL/VirB6 plasmid conjugal transfer protein n=1 Tax=Amycolatopsis pigmentata TaxID=450801 RepID=A0ABW5FMF1_9PSEU